MTTQHDFDQNAYSKDRDEALASYLDGQSVGADYHAAFGYYEIAARELGESLTDDDRDDEAIMDLAEQLADEDKASKLEHDLAAAWDRAATIYPYPAQDPETTEQYDDYLSEREQVAAGITMLLQGDATLDELAREHTTALSRERDAMDRLRGAILVAADQGMSESEIARRSDLTRMTVRKILGK